MHPKNINNRILILVILDLSIKINPPKSHLLLSCLINLKPNPYLNPIKDPNFNNSNKVHQEILIKLLISIVKINPLDFREVYLLNNKINKIPDIKDLNTYCLKLKLIISMLSIKIYNKLLIKKHKGILYFKIKINLKIIPEISELIKDNNKPDFKLNYKQKRQVKKQNLIL